MQALNGDNNEAEPNNNKLISLLKWHAWEDLKGWTKSKAKKAYTDLGEKILKNKGYSTEDPKKPRNEREDCIDPPVKVKIDQNDAEQENEGQEEGAVMLKVMSFVSLLMMMNY